MTCRSSQTQWHLEGRRLRPHGAIESPLQEAAAHLGATSLDAVFNSAYTVFFPQSEEQAIEQPPFQSAPNQNKKDPFNSVLGGEDARSVRYAGAYNQDVLIRVHINKQIHILT
jgi:hypothetical protein